MNGNYGIWQSGPSYELSDQKLSGMYFEKFNFKCLNSHIKPVNKEALEGSETDTSSSKRYRTPSSKYKFIYQIMNSPSEAKLKESASKQVKTAGNEDSLRGCARQLLDSFESAKTTKERLVVKRESSVQEEPRVKELHPLLMFFSRAINKTKEVKKSKTLGECVTPELKDQLHQNLLRKLLDL